MVSAPETSAQDRRAARVVPLLLMAVLGAILGLGVGWLVFAPTSPDGEVEALIDEYLAAWDAGDGDAVVSFMTEDGIHYSGGAALGKQAGDDGALGLAAFVESKDYASFEPVSDPIVSEGPPYEAAVIVRVSASEQDYFEAAEAFLIVEAEDGSLKIAVDSSEIAGLD